MRTAAIWIDPGRVSGRPCLMGTRLYLEHPAHHLAHPDYTLGMYRDDYDLNEDDLSDRDILAAVAWWVLNDRSRTKFDRQIRKEWRKWAEITWDACWHTDHVPSPPPALEAA